MENVWRIFHLILVFLEFLDSIQSVRVLSNLELEKLFTILLSFSVCSWSIFREIRGLVFSFQIKIRGKWQEEEQLFIEVALYRHNWLILRDWFLVKQPCVVLIYSYLWYMYTKMYNKWLKCLLAAKWDFCW